MEVDGDGDDGDDVEEVVKNYYFCEGSRAKGEIFTGTRRAEEEKPAGGSGNRW